MNYKYGNAIVLGLLLATISMSKVATAALVTYNISVNYGDVARDDWGLSFEGTVIIDTEEDMQFGTYSVDGNDWVDYELIVNLDGDRTDFDANDYAVGVGTRNGLIHRFKFDVVFDQDYNIKYADFGLGGRGSDMEFEVLWDIGCGMEWDPRKPKSDCNRADQWRLTTGMFAPRKTPITFGLELIDVVGGETDPIVTVPVPYVLTIFALGLIGLASRRFKKQS
jgi:hypothetical protein